MFLIIIGFFAGIIGGMGMGGGTILIPALILFAHIDPKIAQSVNLLSSIPMTIFALIIHIRNKNVVFSILLGVIQFKNKIVRVKMKNIVSKMSLKFLRKFVLFA